MKRQQRYVAVTAAGVPGRDWALLGADHGPRWGEAPRSFRLSRCGIHNANSQFLTSWPGRLGDGTIRCFWHLAPLSISSFSWLQSPPTESVEGLGVLLVWIVSPSIARNLRRTRRGSAQDDSEPANGTLTKAGDKRTRGGRVLGALGGHYGDGLAFLEGPEEGMASISVVYSDHSSMIFQGLLVMQIYRAARVLA